MAKQPRDEPRRVESQARMTVAGQEPAARAPLMSVVEDATVPPDTIELHHPDGRVDQIINVDLSAMPEEIPPFEPAPVDPEIAALFPTGTIYRPESGPDRPWYPIEVAPRDGALLEALTTDGSEFLMVWRTTSRFNAKTSRWEPIGFWSSHLSRAPILVEPVSWRRPEGFAAPGMLMT